MGRKATPGLQFYRVDCGHIQERKQRLLFSEYDSDGYYIWSALTDFAHATWGYYFDYSNTAELEWFVSDICRKNINLVKEVIKACVRRELFDKDVFASCQILTCEDMQYTYLRGTADRRSKGTIITMHEDHLCIPYYSTDPDWRNIHLIRGKSNIVPAIKGIVLPNNSQREKIQEEKINIGAPVAPPDPESFSSSGLKKDRSEGQNAGPRRTRKVFVAPSLDQVKSFFVEKIGDTKDPRSWPMDKCVTQASKFFNHYTANGWVQGKGKLIVDWEASVCGWINNELEGKFNSSFTGGSPVAKQEAKPKHEPTKILDKTQQEINYLYESFLEGNEGSKFIYTQQYDYLVNRGMITLTEEEKKDIRARSLKSLQDRQLPTDNDALATLMKKEAVVEYFKQIKTKGRKIVFEL